MPKKSFYLKSMTAYGRASVDFPYGRFTAEIQSVNRRHLELNINLPRLLLRYETEIRNCIASKVGRGMVQVYVRWQNENKRAIKVEPNLPLARGLKQAWSALAKELQFDLTDWSLLLSREEDLFIFDEEFDEKATYPPLMESIEKALQDLIGMKCLEGERLVKDFTNRVEFLKTGIQEIREISSHAADKYRQKLKDRLAEFSIMEDFEEKLLREVALLAEKVDITEEIVRFESHLKAVENLLGEPLRDFETKGKTIDFIMQELHREINTIGAKAWDIEISKRVVLIKAELEKMREQVQNIE